MADRLTILVTGASGLLGGAVCHQALQQKCNVVGVHLRHTVALPNVAPIRANLTDADAVAHIVTAVRPSWIIHCAAVTQVDWCEENPAEARRANVESTRNLALAARAAGAQMLYVSTDSVFDGARGRYSESDTPAPLNVYARTKLEGEFAARDILPDSLIVRTNLYGWNPRRGQGLAEWALARLRTKTEVPGFFDVTFSPILANDLAARSLALLGIGATGLYHLAGGEACSKYEFAVALARTFELDEMLVRPVSVETAHLRAPRPRNSSLDCAKAAALLGDKMPSLPDGLKHFRALENNGYASALGGN